MIIGQERALETLTGALKSNRLSGSYLFAGPEGVGKFTTAKLLAASVFCERGEFPPCGNCPPCRKVEHGNHPDIVYLEPRGAEIRIDDVRETNRLISFKPFEGSKKFAIVDNAEKLRREAGNAMLKTLEEPPPDTLIILIASSTAALLPTIVSRTQIIRFNAIPRQEMIEWLIETRGIEREEAEFLYSISSGSIGRALALTKKRAVPDLREQTERLLEALEGGIRTRIEAAENIAGSRDELHENISFLLMLCDMKLAQAQDSAERTKWAGRIEAVLNAEHNLKFNPANQLAAEAMFLSMP